MGDLLMPVRTTKIGRRDVQDDQLLPAESSPREHSNKSFDEIHSLEQALAILRSRPQREALFKVLRWISGAGKAGLDINSQTPRVSQVIVTLVNDILPDHWSYLRDDESDIGRRTRDLIVWILSSVGGISAITTRMRFLIKSTANPEETGQIRQSGKAVLLDDLLSVLGLILVGDSFLLSVWSKLAASLPEAARKSLLWKELVTLLANGKVLSVTSEADDLVANGSSKVHERSWLSDGGRYSSWLGRNLGNFLARSTEEDGDVKKAWAQMMERAVTLGHIDQIIEASYDEMIHGTGPSVDTYGAFTSVLGRSTKKAVIISLLRSLAKIHLSAPDVASPSKDTSKRIGCVAALLHQFVSNQRDFVEILLEWLCGDGVLQDLRVRRAVVAALAENPDALQTAISDSLRAFGDKLHIKHTPILRQEGTTENLLLLAGYTHRKDAQYIAQMARSSLYLNAISNRLAASSPRASTLGIYVGTAISELVDPQDKRMKFSSEELTSAQGRQYRGLTRIQDPLESTDGLKQEEVSIKPTATRTQKSLGIQRVKSQSRISQALKVSKIISIEEVERGSDSEHDDLPTYAKPDSDASDSDEDPTVINRDKPTAPVYINDLISGLRDTDNYDRHRLAFTNASSLIRRKASFGTEVTDNAQDLASILTGLQDKWNISDFEELRLQGMIAVLISQPLQMGQWFSTTYFNGDYSISQRAAVLTTLGLGARELAGYGKEDAALTKSTQDASFPSKQLPPGLHALYASPDMAPIAAASKQLEQSILRPMALNAADAFSGPNVLKIRTFSSRMEVEKKRVKPIPNALAKVVADGFFFPLTGRFSMHTQGFGTSSPLLRPPLLPLYLRTLSLLLHASGRSTLLLPQLTHEFLLLLLSLRHHTSAALPTLEAFLFAFLTVLEVNNDQEGQRRLVTENAKEVLELMALVEAVFDKVRGDGEEEEKVRMLAAGCVGRWREVAEAEEGRLMGIMSGFI